MLFAGPRTPCSLMIMSERPESRSEHELLPNSGLADEGGDVAVGNRLACGTQRVA